MILLFLTKISSQRVMFVSQTVERLSQGGAQRTMMRRVKKWSSVPLMKAFFMLYRLTDDALAAHCGELLLVVYLRHSDSTTHTLQKTCLHFCFQMLQFVTYMCGVNVNVNKKELRNQSIHPSSMLILQ